MPVTTDTLSFGLNQLRGSPDHLGLELGVMVLSQLPQHPLSPSLTQYTKSRVLLLCVQSPARGLHESAWEMVAGKWSPAAPWSRAA